MNYKNLTLTECNFIMEVKKNGGGLVHDLSNKLHYDYTMECLGGEQRIQKGYPEVYKLIQRTKKAHIEAAAPEDPFKPDKGGISNDMHIKGVSFKNSQVNANIEANLLLRASWIHIQAKLIDTYSGEILDNIDKHGTNIAEMKASLQKVLSQKNKIRDFTVVVNFNYGLPSDDSLEKGVIYTEVYEDFKVYNEIDILKSVVVEHPAPQGFINGDAMDRSNRKRVKVLYNRQNDNCDYCFQVPVVEKKIKIKLPVAVRIKVNENFRITGINPDYTGYMILKKEDMSGVHYYGTEFSYMRSLGETEDKETVFLFTFSNEWENGLSTSSSLISCTDVDITGSYSMNVESTDGLYSGNVGILFSSEEDKQGALCGKAQKISFYWGCLAKGTLLILESGKLRNVERLKKGDKVRNQEGEAVAVKNIITGPEDRLVVIKTISGKAIRVTDSHPILTKEGMKRADKITLQEEIQTQDGWECVQELYPQDYRDMVFSLEFDHPQILSCNGIYTGDYQIQNCLKAEKKEAAEYRDIPLTSLQKEWENLHRILRKERMNDNGH